MKERDVSIEKFTLSAQKLGELLGKVSAGELDNNRARDVFNHLVENDVPVAQAISSLGIEAVDSGEIDSLCQELIDANPKVVEDVLSGNDKAVGSLIGQARSKNPNANPKVVRDTVLKLIKGN